MNVIFVTCWPNIALFRIVNLKITGVFSMKVRLESLRQLEKGGLSPRKLGRYVFSTRIFKFWGTISFYFKAHSWIAIICICTAEAFLIWKQCLFVRTICIIQKLPRWHFFCYVDFFSVTFCCCCCVGGATICSCGLIHSFAIYIHFKTDFALYFLSTYCW